MSIYVTGDTHHDLDIEKLNKKNFPAQKSMTKNDYVIICGDFGGVWYNKMQKNSYILKWWENKNFTTLFVDGNHENFNMLESFEIKEWMGGRARFVRPSVIQLLRGEVYTIGGLKFFTLGGAESTDKESRIIDVSWWWQEELYHRDIENALNNLNANNNKVDYIITHTAPYSFIENVAYDLKYKSDAHTEFLEKIREDVEFKKWYFGHFHVDVDVSFDNRLVAVYNKIHRII